MYLDITPHPASYPPTAANPPMLPVVLHSISPVASSQKLSISGDLHRQGPAAGDLPPLSAPLQGTTFWKISMKSWKICILRPRMTSRRQRGKWKCSGSWEMAHQPVDKCNITAPLKDYGMVCPAPPAGRRYCHRSSLVFGRRSRDRVAPRTRHPVSGLAIILPG